MSIMHVWLAPSIMLQAGDYLDLDLHRSRLANRFRAEQPELLRFIRRLRKHGRSDAPAWKRLGVDRTFAAHFVRVMREVIRAKYPARLWRVPGQPPADGIAAVVEVVYELHAALIRGEGARPAEADPVAAYVLHQRELRKTRDTFSFMRKQGITSDRRSIKHTAKALGVSKNTAAKLVREGRTPAEVLTALERALPATTGYGVLNDFTSKTGEIILIPGMPPPDPDVK